jgi:hypothetical protein
MGLIQKKARSKSRGSKKDEVIGVLDYNLRNTNQHQTRGSMNQHQRTGSTNHHQRRSTSYITGQMQNWTC